jgi:hypothetical protein
MKMLLLCGLVVALFASTAAVSAAEKAEKAGGQIAHMVYFTLKDNSPESRKKLVDACKKYLDKHEGTVYFSAGTLVDDLKREVNDRDWDVALHLIFKDRASHDKYQEHPRHIKFIEENRDNWKKVRVFDAVVND